MFTVMCFVPVLALILGRLLPDPADATSRRVCADGAELPGRFFLNGTKSLTGTAEVPLPNEAVDT